jgi:hypothetical protein
MLLPLAGDQIEKMLLPLASDQIEKLLPPLAGDSSSPGGGTNVAQHVSAGNPETYDNPARRAKQS